ncbi:hypothetical protein [Acetobacter sp. DsW_063]|uniref:hypothetical protein n=1 Tax=Acetobacter sp. DsW_063 TaxID=1514894 RepID=UPI000A39E45F|nr:hypothetical protein [Acetobacter sp. DsW_063]OUJ16121.1 hypothetical protein HK28_03715 [Acetobacter sp. DsW_063]
MRQLREATPYIPISEDEGKKISNFLWENHEILLFTYVGLKNEYNPDNESDEQKQLAVDILNIEVQVGIRVAEFMKSAGSEERRRNRDLGRNILKFL